MSSCLVENDSFHMSSPTLPLSSDLMDLEERCPMNDPVHYDSNEERRWKSRRVRFAAADTVVCIESTDDWTDYERHASIWSASELFCIKKSAKSMCKRYHKANVIQTETDSIRGMDVYFPSRQRAHAKYIAHVVQASRGHLKEQLAHLCDKWSQTSKERAAAVALQDFYEAYFPDIAVSTPVKAAPSLRRQLSLENSSVDMERAI